MHIHWIAHLRWLLVELRGDLGPLKQAVEILEFLRFPCGPPLVRDDFIRSKLLWHRLSNLFLNTRRLLIWVTSTGWLHEIVSGLCTYVLRQLILLAVR